MGAAWHARGLRGKLIAGARLTLYHPVWDRTCGQCKRYHYGADGALKRDHKGQPLERPEWVPTPCQSCPKVPAEAKAAGLSIPVLRELAEEIGPENRAAWRFYLQCKATGRFPDDRIVAWYSGIFREAEDSHARYLAERGTLALEVAAELLILKRG